MIGRKTQPKSEVQQERRGFDAFDMRIGDIMRGERATMGKSLLDIQRELKIKANYIAAVENADPSVFETPGFIAGYVRSYSRYLGLDPEWAFEQFCKESGFTGVEGLSAVSSTKAKPNAKVSGARIVDDPFGGTFGSNPLPAEGLLSQIEPRAVASTAVLLGLIAALGYGAWSVLQEVQRVQFAPVDQSPGVVSDIAGLGDGNAPSADQQLSSNFEPPSADALDRLYRPQVLETPVFTARDAPIASLDLDAVGTLIPPRPEEQVATAPRAVNPNLDPLNAPTPVKVVQDLAPNVVLFAVRPAWVRVASADGTILFEKILDTGEQYIVPLNDEDPILRAGNSGSVFFNVGEKTFGPAGSGTSVAKNVALGVEAINENYAEADLEDDADLAAVLTAMAPVTVEAVEDATDGAASE